MNYKEAKPLIKQKVNDIAKAHNMEIVHFDMKKDHGKVLVTVYLYHQDGLNLDHCVLINRELSDWLEEKDYIEQEYSVEVSSPGLDWPLKTDDDLRRNLNKKVSIKLYGPINGEKLYEGILKDYNNEDILIIKDNQETIELPRDKVALMTQTISF